MRTILAELGLIAFVFLGLAYAAGVFTSSTSAVSKAEFIVSVKPIYTSQGTYLEIAVKNVGGTAVTIQNVTIDGTDVTVALGWGGVLQPGGELRTTIQAPQGFTSGQHILQIVYEESGQIKTASFQFTA